MDARDAHETMYEVKEAQETKSEVKTERGTRYIALMIAILAALLAIVEVAGGNAEQTATKSNIDATNLWAFFQAKTIRQSNLRALVEYAELEMPELSPERAERSRRQVATWRATIDRWESEPPTQEGRKELLVRAKAVERERDTALAADNMFDFASASLQLAIVLASAAIVIGTAWLAWVAGGVGIVGIGFAALGGFAPTLITL